MTDPIRDLLISLASHMAYMQGQLEAHHQLDNPEDYYWFRESVTLRQKVADTLADEPAVPAPPADTYYEWELEDAQGEWKEGGASNSQSGAESEGMRYLQTYAQGGPHKLIIRQRTLQTINEFTYG